MVIIQTVNIDKEFYNKLRNMNVKSIRLGVNDNMFKESHKVENNGNNIIITTYSTVSKCVR